MDNSQRQEMVLQLGDRFDLDEHEVRKGGSGKWFVYLKNLAIIYRLDSIAPMGWQTKIMSTTRIDDRVEVVMEMTIGDITRSYDGVAEDNRRKGKDGKPDVLFPLNTAKAATTDAFKRVASMFGIGLYLQACGTIQASNDKDAFRAFAKWYNEVASPAKRPGPPPPKKHNAKGLLGEPEPPPATTSNGRPLKPAWSKVEIETFNNNVGIRFPGSLATRELIKAELKIGHWHELGTVKDAVNVLYTALYDKCAPVLVDRMRYFAKELGLGDDGKMKYQKYLEFCVDEKVGIHHKVRAYDRRGKIKNEWLGEFAYHMLGWENFDDPTTWNMWADIEADLVMHYELNDHGTLIATGIGHNIVDPQAVGDEIPL